MLCWRCAAMAESDEVWASPLTENERQLIEKALDENDPDEVRSWLVHCVQILDAQTRLIKLRNALVDPGAKVQVPGGGRR